MSLQPIPTRPLDAATIAIIRQAQADAERHRLAERLAAIEAHLGLVATPAPAPTADLLTVKQAAAYCTCHPDTIRRAKATGVLPYLKVGTTYRFKVDDLEVWMAARP